MFLKKIFSATLLSTLLFSTSAMSVPAVYDNMDQSLINFSSLKAQLGENLLSGLFGSHLDILGKPNFYSFEAISSKVTDKLVDSLDPTGLYDKVKDLAKEAYDDEKGVYKYLEDKADEKFDDYRESLGEEAKELIGIEQDASDDAASKEYDEQKSQIDAEINDAALMQERLNETLEQNKEAIEEGIEKSTQEWEKELDELRRDRISQAPAGFGFSSVLVGINGTPSASWQTELFGSKKAYAFLSGGGSGLISKIAALNPLGKLLGSNDNNCGALTSGDAVTKCYYSDNEASNLPIRTVSEKKRNVTAALNKDSGELMANATSIANRTGEFEEKKSAIENEATSGTTVSEVLTLRGSSELVNNNLMGVQLDMDIQRLSTQALTTYQYINASGTSDLTKSGKINLNELKGLAK